MLNSIPLRGWIRMPTAALFAAGMVATAAAPPLAGQQQEILDTRLVIINVTSTEEWPDLNATEFEMLRAALVTVCPLLETLLQTVVSSVGHSTLQQIPVPEGGVPGAKLATICTPGAIPKEPRKEITDYTIFIRENRMAVHAEGFPVMVWQVIPGSRAQMYFYDPETGRIESFGQDHVGNPMEIINLQAADRMTNRPIDYIPRGPSLLGAAGELLGYPVHRYELGHQMVPEWARNAPFGTMRIYSDEEAWIAHDTPYNEVVGRFFENFAAHVDSGTGGMLGGLASSMAQLARLGVPMKTVDTSSVRLTLTRMGVGPGNPETGVAALPDDELILEQSVTTTVVTDIRFGHYGVEELEGIFGPDPPSLEGNPDSPTGPEGGDGDSCDCSCNAMRKMEDLDKNDPEAMQKAMCARQCIPQWVACAMNQ